MSKAFTATIDDIWPSFKHGWRFNPKNEFGVLYLSISEKCCAIERWKQFQGNEKAFQSFVLGEFRVNIKHCLDLTAPSVLKKMGVDVSDLIGDDFAIPQSIAREARILGFEAVIAPSAASEECQNLVVFKDKLAPPSYCLLSKTQDR